MATHWLFDSAYDAIYRSNEAWFGKKGEKITKICDDPDGDGFLVDLLKDCQEALFCLHSDYAGEKPVSGSKILHSVGPAARSSHTNNLTLFRILVGERRHVIFYLELPNGQRRCYGMSITRSRYTKRLNYTSYFNGKRPIDHSQLNTIAD